MKYKKKMSKTYGEKYLFGCVAVKTINNSFITTLRGKEDFDEFTVVNFVDEKNYIITAFDKKATLNAPLLNQLLKNDKVKAIVHMHEFNDNFKYYEYAFPGTVRDSERKISKSFNIKHYGVFLLFDDNKNII